MNTLVIDCATEACSVALFAGEKLFAGENLLAGDYRILGRGHAEQLVPMIAALPGKGRAGRIAVSLGPGSFTGVRVGLAAARALAFAWGAELAGYSTLALIAAMARAEAGARPVAVATNGGHGEWFVQSFDADGTENGEPLSLDPDRAAQLAQSSLVAGSQAKALVDLRGTGEALTILPDARAFGLLAPEALTVDVRPHYVRGPDAKLPAPVP